MIIKNFMVGCGCIFLVALAIISIIDYFKKPKEELIADVKEWLKIAVAQAEKELGSKTGQLKLRYVYDLFLQRFPELHRFVSFDDISEWVDVALEWLTNQLESNTAMIDYVEDKR